jgi:hypothetical protein
MIEQKWTKEPWPDPVVLQDRTGLWALDVLPTHRLRGYILADDYNRAKECVNALAGIEDPSAFVKSAAEKDRHIRSLKERCAELEEQARRLDADYASQDLATRAPAHEWICRLLPKCKNCHGTGIVHADYGCHKCYRGGGLEVSHAEGELLDSLAEPMGDYKALDTLLSKARPRLGRRLTGKDI